jgi:hypothetical protein
MSHSRWTITPNRADWIEIRKVSPKVLAETRSWVQGYILALEDVLKDMGDHHIFVVLREKVQESLDSARATLSTLHDVIEGAGDGQELQAPTSEAEAP